MPCTPQHSRGGAGAGATGATDAMGATGATGLRSAGTTLSDASIRRIFSELDLDSSGTLSEDEMAAVFGQLHLPFSKADFQRVIADHDADGDGVLSLNEFVSLVRAGSTKRRELFDAIDTDADGVWSPKEIRTAFAPYFASQSDLEAFVKHLMRTDLDKDGAISFEEFERWAAFQRANSLCAILDQVCGASHYSCLNCCAIHAQRVRSLLMCVSHSIAPT
jgi:calcium-binding protein CML